MGKQYIARVDIHFRDAHGSREVKNGEVFDADLLLESHAKSHLESGCIEEYSDEPGQASPSDSAPVEPPPAAPAPSVDSAPEKKVQRGKKKADSAPVEPPPAAPAPSVKYEKIEDIPEIDEAVLSALNGLYSTVEELGQAIPEELAEIAGISEERAAKIVEAAKG
jgi:hypothetical protein